MRVVSLKKRVTTLYEFCNHQNVQELYLSITNQNLTYPLPTIFNTLDVNKNKGLIHLLLLIALIATNALAVLQPSCNFHHCH